jgi:hypothetical protein
MNLRQRQAISNDTATRYEVALMRGETVLEVLGYTAQKTKMGIIGQFRGKDVTHHFTDDELNSEWKYSAKNGIQFNNGSIKACFTGKTEREAASSI